jgi:triosephosphate isomerase
MARRKFIAGNWKMNLSLTEAESLVLALHPLIANELEKVDVAVCPTYICLAAVKHKIGSTKIKLGAQNAHAIEKDGKLVQSGAYTGEVSPKMLKEAGCEWVILGHSERRQYFGETDAKVNVKVKACYEAGLKPIICVGETLEEREANKTAQVIETQVKGCLANLPADKVKESVIAYEPVWAIGTGKTATPEMAQEVHAQIRKLLIGLFGADVANAVRIQYGGSMNAKNAKELLAQPDIDGGLIGGAALKADDFSVIVKSAV